MPDDLSPQPNLHLDYRNLLSRRGTCFNLAGSRYRRLPTYRLGRKPINQSYRAFIAKQSSEEVICEVAQRTLKDLPAGDVTILVSWSSINYKDGLASVAKGGVAITLAYLGIDLVMCSADERPALWGWM